MPRLAVLVIIALALGCHRVGEHADELGDDASDGQAPDASCGGLLTRTPVVMLGETIAFRPEVIVDGDTIVVVEPGQHGVLRRLDRCTGEELRSRSVPFLARAILHEGAIVLTGIYEGPIALLARWDEAADDLEYLSEAPFSRLLSHSSGLYLGARDEIYRFDEASSSLELVHTIDTLEIAGLFISHVGVNEAGLYYRRDYDCGCTPTLSRWSIGADESSTVPGSAGARRLASLGDRIVLDVDRDPSGVGSGIDDIVELPAEGGEPLVLFSGSLDDGPVEGIAANDEWVCWTNLARAPRCLRRSDPGELVEFEGQFEAGEGAYRQLALAEDAVYWFAERNGESTLMAAGL
ncbi:MAG: hypothetical protein R6X02_30990 [Enhygromyxa sp.]